MPVAIDILVVLGPAAHDGFGHKVVSQGSGR